MNKVLGQALLVTNENATIAGTTEAQNKRTQDNYTPNSPEFKEAVLSLFSKGGLTHDIAELLLKPAGITVRDANIEAGTTSSAQRISDLRVKYGFIIHSVTIKVQTRRGQTEVKRYWIRECDQPWWDSKNRCFVDSEP